MGEPHIVVTKFTIPPTRGHLLPRSPLIELLHQSRTLPLVLLSASAGSGKTTLLAAWASQHSHPVAWLSLDSLDNDPLHFWNAVMMALHTRFPSVGKEAFAWVRSSQSPDILAFLIGSQHSKPLCIVCWKRLSASRCMYLLLPHLHCKHP